MLVYATRSLSALVGTRRSVSKDASTSLRTVVVAVVHDTCEDSSGRGDASILAGDIEISKQADRPRSAR
jgi:hypothetical protein